MYDVRQMFQVTRSLFQDVRKLFYGSLKLSFTPLTFRSQISWSPWGAKNRFEGVQSNFKSPLPVAVENFPDVVEQCSGYLKHSTSSYNYARTKIRVRRHANQKISINTRLLLKIKTVQTVFPSDIHLNCHLSQKKIFFIKSQNRQKLSENDEKTFQRRPKRYIFKN